MQIIETIAELRARIADWRRENPDGTVGFVPTMGYLHEGHASLIRRSAVENGLTIVSVFVNPLQFGPNEDFERYPRDPGRDRQVSEAAGADLLFMPSVAEMYPRPTATRVMIADLTDRLCGASRPGHFDGVGTVVSKLFHIVMPDKAYFGLKDAQQVAVIERMVEDLNFPVRIVPCETVREPDGLALSSRNVYLNAEERRQAVVLYETLKMAEEKFFEPGMTPGELKAAMHAHLKRAPLAETDYAEVLTWPHLESPADIPFVQMPPGSRFIAALAVKFGRTRLIDNRLLATGPAPAGKE
ncbi:MAG: pantoate--beta-alanine ligase [Thermobacillus sp.]|uniref:Pantothenate synthetase n=1 Tax=Thermobacillus composti (strain DSM 18247 / JCM 13945 / KWC4) TaxID=717605 RepID=L0EDR7_THECK|nr:MULTISPECIES: pantoate--beta-alanine ligase [Thermobacillus]AGA57947.1 pantoate--beta-alanine ligase [Thermobacillus composti KWC4]REK56880.1 MAG: pantoate--beta-alanine ligase [Thermobacillus sp.]